MASRNALHYVGARDCPARAVSLRAIDPERYTIVNEVGAPFSLCMQPMQALPCLEMPA